MMMTNFLKTALLAALVGISVSGANAQDKATGENEAAGRSFWAKMSFLKDARLEEVIYRSSSLQSELDVSPYYGIDRVNTVAGQSKFQLWVRASHDIQAQNMSEGSPVVTLRLTIHPEDGDVNAFLHNTLPEENLHKVDARGKRIAEHLDKVNYVLENYFNTPDEQNCESAYISSGLISPEPSGRKRAVPVSTVDAIVVRVDIIKAVRDVLAEKAAFGTVQLSTLLGGTSPYAWLESSRPSSEERALRQQILPAACEKLALMEDWPAYRNRYRQGLLNNETPDENYLTYSFTIDASTINYHQVSTAVSQQYFIKIKEQLLKSAENKYQYDEVYNALKPIAGFLNVPMKGQE